MSDFGACRAAVEAAALLRTSHIRRLGADDPRRASARMRHGEGEL